jgi:hypothetical protein
MKNEVGTSSKTALETTENVSCFCTKIMALINIQLYCYSYTVEI